MAAEKARNHLQQLAGLRFDFEISRRSRLLASSLQRDYRSLAVSTKRVNQRSFFGARNRVAQHEQIEAGSVVAVLQRVCEIGS